MGMPTTRLTDRCDAHAHLGCARGEGQGHVRESDRSGSRAARTTQDPQSRG